MQNFRLCAFADEAASSLDEQIIALEENGISLLELRDADGKNVSKLTLQEAKEIRKKLDGRGIQVWSIGSPVGKVDIKDPFEPHFDSFRHMLELAGILGASHFRLFSFYGTGGSEVHEPEILSRLSRFTDEAEACGVVLCHENEKEIYGEQPDRCLRLHKAIPKLRAVFDPANFILSGADVPAAWELLRPYTEYLHIKDATANGYVVPAGKGIGNIPALLAGFGVPGGVLTVEPHLYTAGGVNLHGKNEVSDGLPVYLNRRAAFDAAVAALREVLG